MHLPLDDILRGKGSLHVLRVLCSHPGEAFSAPELSASGRLALSHVQNSLRRLESQGIVDRHVAGRVHSWAIAQNNGLLPALRHLFEVERGLSEDLESDLRKTLAPLPVHRAILFGSVARGEETGWSDVDLLLELRSAQRREEVWDALEPLALRIREKFGLTLAPLLLTPEEDGSQLSPSFLGAVVREGKVMKERD